MKYRIPDENAPGWLRRQQKLVAFRKSEGDEQLTLYLEWLAEFVDEDDHDKAIEILLNASKAEIDELQDAIAGGGADPKESESTADG